MAMLTQEEKKQAEEAAKKILYETFGDLELVEFPVDLNAILEKYALTLKTGEFIDQTISGAFNRDVSEIYISDKESPERQSFTVAHEIGHFELHKSRKTDILFRKQVWQFANSGLEKDETQANWFAANLLMPTEAVKRMWKISHNINKLSEIFGVSKTAISFRLKDLNLISKNSGMPDLTLPSEVGQFSEDVVRHHQGHSLSHYEQLHEIGLRDVEQQIKMRPRVAIFFGLLLFAQNIVVFALVWWALNDNKLASLQLVFVALTSASLIETYKISQLIVNRLFEPIDYAGKDERFQ